MSNFLSHKSKFASKENLVMQHVEYVPKITDGLLFSMRFYSRYRQGKTVQFLVMYQFLQAVAQGEGNDKVRGVYSYHC